MREAARNCTRLPSSVKLKKNKLPAPFGWVGGKRLLSKKIVTLIPPHKTYVEPFCGAASVFWAKEPSEVEVLNDLDPDLMRFYRDIGSIDRCDIVQISQDWDKLKARDGRLEACEFLAEVLCSYGAKREYYLGRGKHGTSARRVCMNNAPRFHSYLPSYKERLSAVKLYNEDWRKVTLRYDSLETFFYFDPPFHGVRGFYYAYGDDQLARLAETLPKLKGKWLLSYDDHPDVREAFKVFNVKVVEADYILHRLEHIKKPELLIANYLL